MGAFMRIRLVENDQVVDALLDETHETACYLNPETDDFNTITKEHFEILGESEEIEKVQEVISDSAPMLTLANVLGGKLKSLTVEFK